MTREEMCETLANVNSELYRLHEKDTNYRPVEIGETCSVCELIKRSRQVLKQVADGGVTVRVKLVTVDISEQQADVIEELWGEDNIDAKIGEGLDLLIDQFPALEFSEDWQAAHPLTMEYVRGRHQREHGGATEQTDGSCLPCSAECKVHRCSTCRFGGTDRQCGVCGCPSMEGSCYWQPKEATHGQPTTD